MIFFKIDCDTKYRNETSTERLFHDSALCTNPGYTANLLSVVYIVTLLQPQVGIKLSVKYCCNRLGQLLRNSGVRKSAPAAESAQPF